MLEAATMAKALVEAEANHSVKNILYAAPTADETRVREIIADEIGRLHAKMSVVLMHIEGEYESKVANLQLQVAPARLQNSTSAKLQSLAPQTEKVSFLRRIFKW